MKKRASLLTFLIFTVISLNACAMESTGLSESELDQVAEYAAKLILKHVDGYEPTLLEELSIRENPSLNKEEFEVAGETTETTSETASTETETSTETASETETSSGSAISEVEDDGNEAGSLNEIYGVAGFEVVYGGAGLYDRYPKNEGYFSLVASENMKLYVVEFSIRNTGSKSKKFSQGDGVEYGLTFDGTKFYKPSLTLLENDIQAIEVSIEGGKSAKGVLVFNISSDEDKNKAKLKLTNGSLSYTLSVAQ